jgi:hypothetical protein
MRTHTVAGEKGVQRGSGLQYENTHVVIHEDTYIYEDTYSYEDTYIVV